MKRHKTFGDYWDKLTFEEVVAVAAIWTQKNEGASITEDTDSPHVVIQDMELDLCRFALSSTETFKKYLDEMWPSKNFCCCYACKHIIKIKKVFK